VVAIILVIVAIAIPNLMKSRMAANQSSAVASVRTLGSAEVVYWATYNTGYSPDLISLQAPSSGNQTASAAGLIDSVLAAGSKNGYSFLYSSLADSSGKYTTYSINAAPSAVGNSGVNYYFADQTGVIRVNQSGSASAGDSPIGN
jgi:hypothetical protein